MAKPTLKHLSNLLLNTPLLVLPSKLYAILNAIGDRIGFNDINLDVGYEVSEENEPQKGSDNVAVIPVHGTLTNRDMKMDAMSTTFRSYEAIRREFNQALADDKIEKIVFDVESPGGEAAGLLDLSDEIYRARGKKPIFSIINDYAFSAAYGIASSAEKIYISRTGGAGSVGVIAQHVDQSKYDEELGVKYTPIFAGARKNDFSPHKPLSDKAKEVIQEEVDDNYELFTAMVARNLGVSQDVIKKTEAGLFFGEKAIRAGLAHELMSPREAMTAISGIQEKVSTNNNNNENKKSQKESEVKSMTLDELKNQHPNLVGDIESSVSEKLTKQFKAEKETEIQAAVTTALDEQSRQFATEKEELNKKVLKLEKNDALRTENEIQTTVDLIWTKTLAESEIPAHMHSKVRKMVNHSQFVKDDEFNKESFTAAVNAEILDWEAKASFAPMPVMGAGAGSFNDSGKNLFSSEKEENKLVYRMLKSAGDMKAANQFKQEAGLTEADLAIQ